MSNRSVNIFAVCLLVFVFFIAVFSMKDDSLTMDEVAHLPAGYSYLTQKDMRLNPEHPPLLKDLAAIPLLFIKGINFPSEIKDWKEDINGQWGFGFNFLYNSGNPADKMIFWGRLPMILILILLGFYVFKWARELFGNKVALLSLFLFSFSPTFLAHGRLVTTDVGAATGVFIASYYFLIALKNPSKRNIIWAGIAFGLAELCKFSVILLIPFFVFLALIWWLVKLGNLKQTFKILILVFIIGYLLIWPIYLYHVWNYPTERLIRDIKVLHHNRPIPLITETLVRILKILAKIPFLNSFANFLSQRLPPFLFDLSQSLSWLAKNPILKPYAQYLTGLCLVIQRGLGGHTTYFLGEVSAAGWKNYFPVVYAIKEPLAFHILTIISLLYASYKIKNPFWRKPFSRLKEWIRVHFPEFAMLTFIFLYWATSLASSLNIGVRHLLPAFPFTFVLVSVGIINFLGEPPSKWKLVLVGTLILWQTISVISIYPHFLAYFNELVGGPDYGYIYTVDSNLDWGQDLKRLKKWVDENKIDKIYVDYFGGSDAQYYLKEKYTPWWGTRNPNEIPKGSYLAVSATFLQGGRGKPVPGFNQPYGYYNWLYNQELVTKIGYSIFVYYIK